MAQTRAPSIRADFKAACSVVSPRTISHSGERLPPIQPAYCTALSILAAGFYDLSRHHWGAIAPRSNSIDFHRPFFSQHLPLFDGRVPSGLHRRSLGELYEYHGAVLRCRSPILSDLCHRFARSSCRRRSEDSVCGMGRRGTSRVAFYFRRWITRRHRAITGRIAGQPPPGFGSSRYRSWQKRIAAPKPPHMAAFSSKRWTRGESGSLKAQ
jgi:hypothetical protein